MTPQFPSPRNVTAADELYSHQLVAPRLVTAHLDETWAERCYHVLHVGPDLMVGMGRAVYPYRGTRTAFANVRAGGVQYSLRNEEPFALGDDPDRGRVGGVEISVVDPMRQIALIADDPAAHFALDLRFTARTIAIPTVPNVISLDGRVVTDYMNFYQSGYYSGTVRIGDREWIVDQRAGFRDRGWGIRKHEGAPRRGFVLFGSIELPDAALYMLLYETTGGRRAFTNGWIVDADGVRSTIVGIDHDLVVENGLVEGGTLALEFDDGRESELRFEVDNRHFLATGGYMRDGAPTGPRAWDVTDPEVLAVVDGQNDNGGRFWLDGVEGHGFIETGIGAHVRYKPEETTND